MSSFYTFLSLIFLILQFSRLDAIQNSKTRLRFETEPESVYAELNKRVHLKCIAEEKKARIQWLINEEPVRIDDKAIFTTPDSLIINLPEKIDQNVGVYTFDEIIKGEIQCRAEYKNQILLSTPAKIIVAFLNDFPLTDEEIKVDVKEKQIAVIPCKPPNSPPKVVTSFSFQNKIIESNDEKYHLMPSGNLQIFNVTTEDSGKYQCLAYNPWSKERKSSPNFITLHVEKQFYNNGLNLDKFTTEKLDFLTTPKQKYSVVRGTELQIFECVASSILPVNISWFREDKKPLPLSRSKIVGGNLVLSNIQTTDEGIYNCEATNGHKTITATSELEVKQTASIKTELQSKIVQINDQTEFECSVNGFPIPMITWYLNGLKLKNLTAEQNDMKIETPNESTSKLIIKKANKYHSGIIQCFASNDLLTVYSVAKLDVVSDFNNDSSVNSSLNNASDSSKPNRGKGKSNKNRTRNRGNDLSKPGKPKVIRLSSDSVIVNWKIPKQNKSPITFFKIQYKDPHQFNQTTDWQTVEEDIPPNINSYSIIGLQSDRFYKFRVMAVYKNQDSQDGKVSDKFFLAKNPIQKRPITIPHIIQSKSDSSSSIEIYWECISPETDDQYDGFLIHYRPTQSAETYYKITIDNNSTREHAITHLVPSKHYDIRMQTYNLGGVSDFSRIETVRTLSAIGEELIPGEEDEVPDQDPNLPPFSKENSKEEESPVNENENHLNITPISPQITPKILNSTDSSIPSSSSTKSPIDSVPINNINIISNNVDNNLSPNDQNNQESKVDPLSTKSPLFYIIVGVIVLINIIILVYCYIIVKRCMNRKPKKSSADDRYDLDDENFILKSTEDDSLSRGFTAKMNSFEPIYSNGGILSTNPHLTKKGMKSSTKIVFREKKSNLIFFSFFFKLAIKNYNHTHYATIGGRKNDVYDSSSMNVRINKFCDDSIASSLLAINKTNNQISKRDLPNRTSAVSHYSLSRPSHPNFNTQLTSTNLHNNIHNKNLLLPNLPSIETKTLGRQQQRQSTRNFEDLYGTNPHFATINRSNSMARLNGTLERRRKTFSSKNDLFSVLNIKEENEDLQQQQQQQQQYQKLQNYRANDMIPVHYVNNMNSNMVLNNGAGLNSVIINSNMNSSIYSTGLNGLNNGNSINNSIINNSSLNSNISANQIMNSTINNYSVDLQNSPRSAFQTNQQQQPNVMTGITTPINNNSNDNRQFGIMQSSC